jgi:mevalonate kinase
MLLGEYAVLEGHSALAMCLDRRIACEAELIPNSQRLRIESEQVFPVPFDLDMSTLSHADPPAAELRLLWPVLRAHAPKVGGLSLRFDANFPPTWGLGSSSASTLAAAGALRALSGEAAVGSSVFREVHSAQRSLQGAASGYDVATQLLGGYVVFSDDVFPAMERVEPPSSSTLHWVVAWTGRKADTGDMIRDVGSRFPVGHPIYAEIGALTSRGVESLRGGDLEALGQALSEGHALLGTLGAVPQDLADRIQTLQDSSDVFGARLSGAGGGDCILVLASDREGAIRTCEKQGFEVLPLAPESRGLVEEEKR